MKRSTVFSLLLSNTRESARTARNIHIGRPNAFPANVDTRLPPYCLFLDSDWRIVNPRLGACTRWPRRMHDPSDILRPAASGLDTLDATIYFIQFYLPILRIIIFPSVRSGRSRLYIARSFRSNRNTNEKKHGSSRNFARVSSSETIYFRAHVAYPFYINLYVFPNIFRYRFWLTEVFTHTTGVVTF